MSTVIKVENLSKQYRLGKIGTGTISHDLNRWWHKMRGNEDPYLKIGEKNDRSVKGESEYVWALQDINFEVKQGEVLGIIGRNGAGKSTLLKILSRTTTPTTGKLKMRGRVASLLEVGTGFHPELTGRENVFLNGAIMGMTKNEIKTKFEEIVDFSGVEKYIDTPVKRYSSGMYVRLAFGVAAHLEPEILIVDEVLAVGDAEFQKKALGKMKDVSYKQGRTVLFVSHNITAIKGLCSKGIVLQNGQLIFNGICEDAVNQYLLLNETNNTACAEMQYEENSSIIAQLTYAALKNKDGELCHTYDIYDDIYLTIEYLIRNSRGGLAIAVDIVKKEEVIFRSFDSDDNPELLNPRKIGKYSTRVKLPAILKAGDYSINLIIGLLRIETIDFQNNTLSFSIQENSVDTTYKSFSEKRPGFVRAELNWQTGKAYDLV